jgi:hypothetical protein
LYISLHRLPLLMLAGRLPACEYANFA